MDKDIEGGMVDRRASARMSPEEGSTGNPPEEAGQDQQPNTSELLEELAKERQRAEENFKQWQRAAADYQNLKRRNEQERGEATRFAQAALVINLLPVYDDLDRALATVDVKLAGLTWVQGIAAIQRKFAMALEAMDFHEIEAEDTRFDPDRHEAVGQAAGEDGKVLHVVQKGYRLGDRVVRPAMVIVGNGAAASAAGESDSNDKS